MSPERLARFFIIDAETGGYRVRKSVRDVLIFSEHNLIKDPPFSRLDWISCRNLLIYLDAEIQKKLIPLFHYALTANGHLLMGTSEGIGEFEQLFTVIDRKVKLYQRKELTTTTQRKALERVVPSLSQQAGVATMPLVLPMPPVLPLLPAQTSTIKANQTMKLSLKELTEQNLLQQCSPAGVLVNAQGDILYLHGRAGMFLELTPGEIGVSNVLNMAREGLQHALIMCLQKAVNSHEMMRMERVRVRINGQDCFVNVSVHPVEYVHDELGEAKPVVVEIITVEPINVEPIIAEPIEAPLFLVSFEYLSVFSEVHSDLTSNAATDVSGELNAASYAHQLTSPDGKAVLLEKIAFLE